ncbi:hypothetical protein DFJ58DRAFT_849273 [Suillus subalutaceus]|uniref:uncharacterized protein n=1 Tax=Suillus subalutaceus TaxID=48586 RepID=UPI001B86FB26|nr:uncharacterized protein DFJ58DRAFT_849273 [Suillus subalutaceus]KAG1827949.1 hypothetical protein DFJ58DRAFT_849273 [Suillus subalutaceus]
MLSKKWTTPEQEEFLLSFMSEFRKSLTTKDYDDLFTRIDALWFERWPEEHVIFKDKPDDYVRTPEDIKALVGAVEMRQQVNPTRHARSKGTRGVLKFDTVLDGGVELKGVWAPQKINIYSHKFYKVKVKHAADNAITTENITNRGLKLNKHHEITRQMYLEESESVKADIDRKYRKAKSSFSKKAPAAEVWEAIKNRQCHKIEGGWKFSVLMGGRDPRTGETSVFNYHVGELQSGAQFNHVYKDFDGMQAAFLGFVQNALAFESTLPHDESAGDEEEKSSSDWDSDEDGRENEGMSQDEHLPTFDTSNLYQMTPQSDEVLGDNASGSHTLLDTLLPKALPTSASKVSTDASTGLAGSSLLAVEFHHPPHSAATFDPIVAGAANFSAFDPHAFATMINNPNFDPGMIPDWFTPPLNSTTNKSLPGQSPANLTSLDNCDRPYLPLSEEVLLPPVLSMNSEEGQDNDSLLNQPEISGTYTIYGPIYIKPSGSAHGDKHTSSPCA